jgi:hypothetical protein
MARLPTIAFTLGVSDRSGDPPELLTPKLDDPHATKRLSRVVTGTRYRWQSSRPALGDEQVPGHALAEACRGLPAAVDRREADEAVRNAHTGVSTRVVTGAR